MNFIPFEKSKILIHIAFHHSNDRIKYLKKILFTINSYIFKKIHVVIDSNIFNASTHKLIKKFNNLNISYNIHENLKDPYLLTWVHRDNILKNITNYDYFIYQEDDLEIKFNVLLDWLKDSRKIYPKGYLRGFLRIEKKYFKKYATDQIEKIQLKKNIIIDEITYITPHNPYTGFWIYSQNQMEKFINSKSWKDGNCKWGIRERAAAGMIWEFGPEKILISLNNNKISKNVLVHHLPDNYVKNKKSKFARIPINRLLF